MASEDDARQVVAASTLPAWSAPSLRELSFRATAGGTSGGTEDSNGSYPTSAG